MSTTVTTTVTTTTIITFGFALGVMLTLALIGLLVARELTATGDGARAIRWKRVLNVGIIPLLVSFVFIVAVQVASLV
jgi:hypothetical protein